MGQAIDQISFTADDTDRFGARLDESLQALEKVLSRPGFGHGDRSLGAELEMVIVDKAGRPIPICKDILTAADDKRLTAEVNRYNIEANLTPVPAHGDAFARIEQEMISVLAKLSSLLESHEGRIVPVGILPTLRPDDLSAAMITPDKRYEALTQQLRSRRGEQFSIALKGREKISFHTDTVAPEGANTSMQIHYRAHPDRFVDFYNAVQLITPLVLGISANSPFLLGKHIWHETRIGLFKQSIDGRSRRRRQLKYPARVHFGHGWLRRSPLELFAETVRLYTPLLPICTDEDPLETLENGKLPTLTELALQMGTVWPWNRPVYDASDDPHVRLELRSLPAGPSPLDMMANAAFALGLAEGLMDDIEGMLHCMPYATLQRNLMIAARNGIGASLLWPDEKSHRLVEKPIVQIALEVLPIANKGLTGMSISDDQQARYLGCIEQRLNKCRNGASWQIETVDAMCSSGLSRTDALTGMLDQYWQLSSSNASVADWP